LLSINTENAHASLCLKLALIVIVSVCNVLSAFFCTRPCWIQRVQSMVL